MSKAYRIAAVIAVLFAFAGCSWLPEVKDETATWSAEKLYDEALADYAIAQLDLAIAGFETVIKYFPKSERAADAQTYIGHSYLQAGKNDNVGSIARRFRVSPANVAQWNDVNANHAFKRGIDVVVYLPVRAAAGAHVGSGARGGASRREGVRVRLSPAISCPWAPMFVRVLHTSL